MNERKPTKIRIIGSVASGKTTLAKQLSQTFHIPMYELDNVVWERQQSGDIRRTDQEREACLHTIVDSHSWIIEGVHNEGWVNNTFKEADIIIFLDTSYSIRQYRIVKRFVLQLLRLEQSNYTPTFKIFFKMFKWNKQFEQNGKPNFKKNFHFYSDKTVYITKSQQRKSLLTLINKDM
ncbi:P-loop NTPase family protein [Aquibacillus kalidii]|uniref:DNA topology modulation protein FlaR n=1 Tax=Aquibacillus kalidii TaxID=2762597 RepID=UPI0016443849|nr:DNA topology modulation protein FlaR [Aquibacillus kalidii]